MLWLTWTLLMRRSADHATSLHGKQHNLQIEQWKRYNLQMAQHELRTIYRSSRNQNRTICRLGLVKGTIFSSCKGQPADREICRCNANIASISRNVNGTICRSHNVPWHTADDVAWSVAGAVYVFTFRNLQIMLGVLCDLQIPPVKLHDADCATICRFAAILSIHRLSRMIPQFA